MGRRRGDQHVQLRSDATFSTEEAFKLRFRKKLSYAEIGQMLGVHPSTVYKRLRRFAALLDDPQAIEAYRDGEPELIDAVKMRILANMADEGRLAKAPPNHLAFAFNALFTANRLARGQSTQNIGLRAQVVLDALGITGGSTGAETHREPELTTKT